MKQRGETVIGTLVPRKRTMVESNLVHMAGRWGGHNAFFTLSSSSGEVIKEQDK